MTELSTPTPLLATHVTDGFDCGEPVLNDWLKKRALKNENSGTSRTFVVCQDNNVVGYYVLTTGSVMHQHAPSKVRRNMPEPIPVMILGRLAVSKHMLSAGLGRGLLKDAILRTLGISKQAGIRVLLVHALSDAAHKFYHQCGFVESPIDTMILMITIKDAVNHI